MFTSRHQIVSGKFEATSCSVDFQRHDVFSKTNILAIFWGIHEMIIRNACVYLTFGSKYNKYTVTLYTLNFVSVLLRSKISERPKKSDTISKPKYLLFSCPSLCEYCLLHLLLKKNPEMFSQHFIECIFHFSSYNQHKSYNKFPESERQEAMWILVPSSSSHMAPCVL